MKQEEAVALVKAAIVENRETIETFVSIIAAVGIFWFSLFHVKIKWLVLGGLVLITSSMACMAYVLVNKFITKLEKKGGEN